MRFKGLGIGVDDKAHNELCEGGIVVIKEEGFDEEYGVIEYDADKVTFVAVFQEGKKVEKVPVKDIANMVVQIGSVYDTEREEL